MKVDARRADAFLQRPDDAVAVVLLYGPDTGLVAQRAEALGRGIAPDLADPFNVADLGAERLREIPSLLVEEAQALSMMGGRRLVRVRRADDASCRKAVEQLLEVGTPEAFVVIEAGELPASSWLRKTAEADARMAAVACYREDDRDLRRSLPTALQELGLRAAPDALEYLVAHLGDDRGTGRRELEKLALYKGTDTSPVTLAEAAATVGDASALALDDAVWAAVRGDGARLDAALDRLEGETESPIRILRATASTVLQLLRLRLKVDDGTAPAEAVASARPPVFWNAPDPYTAALAAHPSARLATWLAALQDAERACKTTGTPDWLVCRRTLARIADSAAAARSR